MAEATIIKVRTDRLLIKTMDQHLHSREKTFDLWITNHSLLYAVAMTDGRLGGRVGG